VQGTTFINNNLICYHSSTILQTFGFIKSLLKINAREMNSDIEGTIFSIQHFSIHDGPGIRTTVFFKGCPLQCLWCHNPESIDYRPEIMLHEEFCIQCGHCLDICPNNCHQMTGTHREFIRDLCTGCGRCAEECCSETLVLKGKKYNVKDVLNEVEKDKPFYEQSGGGMTVSGGEPLAQPRFCRELLKSAAERGLHTVVDTSGYAKWEVFESILEWTSLFLFDVKTYSTELHKHLTGIDNIRIILNLKKLLKGNVPLIVRIPLIHGYNDQLSEMEEIARMIAAINHSTPVHILPYHQFAEQKYHRVGKNCSILGEARPSEDQLVRLGGVFKSFDIPVFVQNMG
jgi:pyruvate formate lyase activating enzyme